MLVIFSALFRVLAIGSFCGHLAFAVLQFFTAMGQVRYSDYLIFLDFSLYIR